MQSVAILPCQFLELARPTPESRSRRPRRPSRWLSVGLLQSSESLTPQLASKGPVLSRSEPEGNFFFFPLRTGATPGRYRPGKPPHSPVHPDSRFAIHPHSGPAALTMSVMSRQVLRQCHWPRSTRDEVDAGQQQDHHHINPLWEGLLYVRALQAPPPGIRGLKTSSPQRGPATPLTPQAVQLVCHPQRLIRLWAVQKGHQTQIRRVI